MLVAARVYERIPAYNCTDGTEPSAATLPLLVQAFGPQTIRRSRRLKRVRAAFSMATVNWDNELNLGVIGL